MMGFSGAGKTLLALFTAMRLGRRIAFIDTENSSASKYADRFGFDVLNLSDFHPEAYIAGIHAAVDAGYDTIIVDSLSPAWDAVKQLVDEEAIRSKSGNTFQAWGRVGTPLWNRLLQAIVQCPVHIIATMRSKTEYVVEQNEKGKATPRKVGTAPMVRDGAEYEFDIVLELDADHRCWATKTRCLDLDGKMWTKDNGAIGDIIRRWLSDGEPVPAAANVSAPANAMPAEAEVCPEKVSATTPVVELEIMDVEPSAKTQSIPQSSHSTQAESPAEWLNEIAALIAEGGFTPEQIAKWKLGNVSTLTPDQAQKTLAFLHRKLSERPQTASAVEPVSEK